MYNPITELIFDATRRELPHRDTMDQYIDYILPHIRRFTENLHEVQFYLEKRWLEVRDDDNFHEAILHIFKPNQVPVEIKSSGEDQGAPYLYTLNGNITKGTWSFMYDNSMIIKHLNRYELYDLAFLSDDFFILKKHGEQPSGSKKYLFLANERLVRNLTWRESMEVLMDIYRYNLSYIFMLIFFVGIVVVILLLSLY